MIHLFYEFQVLTRATQYKNLSSAAMHVGLSQPQLSRILSRIEKELKIVLLDRTTKRKSTWTPTAYRLTEYFSKTLRHFQNGLSEVVKGLEPKTLRIGTLEGLSHIAIHWAQILFKETSVDFIDLEVHDLNRLDELFLQGYFDLMFTLREPSPQKLKNRLTLGYQYLDMQATSESTLVLSSFEFETQRKNLKRAKHLFVSNSLDLRRYWISKFGGKGTIPSDVSKVSSKTRKDFEVYLIGNEHVSPKLWTFIEALKGREEFPYFNR